MTATDLFLGELTTDGTLREIPCIVPGVTARERVKKGSSCTITERLYECPNGWALGVRRGGPLHLANEQTWELFVLTPWRTASGRPVGFVDDLTVEHAIRRLAAFRWDYQLPFAAGRCGS